MAIRNADADTFRSMIEDGFVIVDFYGTTCVPCRLFSRVLEDLDAEIPFLNIVKVNINENPALAEEYGVTAVPTVQFYMNGELVEQNVGVMQAEAVKDVISRRMYA